MDAQSAVINLTRTFNEAVVEPARARWIGTVRFGAIANLEIFFAFLAPVSSSEKKEACPIYSAG